MARECCFEGNHPNYLIVLRHLLRLDDSDVRTGEPLQPKRLEWVFGSPQIKHSVSDDGSIKVGLSQLGFNINSESVTYVTALCDNENQDKVSVLKLLLTSYCVSQIAYDQATMLQGAAHNTDKKKQTTTTGTSTAQAGATEAEIQTSSTLEQLRVSRESVIGSQLDSPAAVILL